MRRFTAVVAGACALALLAPLLHPLVHGRIFIYNDLSWFHLPMRYLYQQAMASGDTVLWTPSIYSGFYLQGEGQIGMFHPLHQLLYRLLPLATAFNLELITNYVAAFAGMTCLLKRLRFTTAASLFGAMLFAFSGFNVLHHHHLNVVAVMAHLPWLLAAADMAITDGRRHAQTVGLAAVAIILCSELLIGFPQAVFWNLVTLAVFGGFRAFETSRWRQLALCAAAVGIGLLLGGIQLLPTADAALHSTRAGLPGDFALTYSLHPFNLVQLWSPYVFREGAYSTRELLLFHEFGIYSGAVPAIALIWVWIRRRALPERRVLIVTLTACASTALVLALGRYGGLATILAHLPVLQSLRAPVRYIVLVQFSLAILASVMLDDLLAIADGPHEPAKRSALALWFPLALGVLTTLLLNTGLLGYGRHTFASAWVAGAGVTLVGVVTVLVFLAGRRARWAIPVLVLATAADLGAWGVRFVLAQGESKILGLIQEIPPPPEDRLPAYAFVKEGGEFSPNLVVMRGYRATGGYVGLFPALVHRVDSRVALRLSGTRWLFDEDGLRHPFNGADRVRLVNGEGQTRAGSVHLVVDRPGLIVADVNAPARGVIALTERFHDGWTATSPTTSPQVVRVEGDFLGCDVDAGEHRVTFRFMPRSFTYGWITSVIGAVFLATLLVARRLRGLRMSS